MEGLYDERAARIQQARRRVHDVIDRFLSDQREVCDDYVDFQIELTRRDLLVRRCEKLTPARGPRLFDQAGDSIDTGDLHPGLGESASEPSLSASKIEHRSRMKLRNHSDDRVVGDEVTAFDLPVADRVRPRRDIC